MSRTYRKRQDPFWLTEEEYENDKTWQRWLKNKSYKSLVSRYHSDAERGMWQIPKHWKKTYRIRPMRSSTRMALRREMQSTEYGNILYPVKKMFDEYYW